jgi:hypothetical protein
MLDGKRLDGKVPSNGGMMRPLEEGLASGEAGAMRAQFSATILARRTAHPMK